MTLRFLLTLMLIIPLVSCKDEAASSDDKEPKIVATPEADPEPTFLGMWREGPMELDENLEDTVTFIRVTYEEMIEQMRVCNLGELETDYDLADMFKSYIFHFFDEGLLTIHITIHIPDGSECLADTMADIPYEVNEYESLSIDGRFVGFLDLMSYREMNLYTGPI